MVYSLTMNATFTVSKSHPNRLNRIKIVSRIFRALIGFVAAMMTLIAALFFAAATVYLVRLAIGSPEPLPHSMHVSFSPHQNYTSPFSIPLPVYLVGAAQLCLAGLGLIVLNRLFKLYEHGDFFQRANIRCLKWLALVVLGIWLTRTALELMAQQNHVDGSGLFYGLGVLLIAWIMDEGRRIQEDQELTV